MTDVPLPDPPAPASPAPAPAPTIRKIAPPPKQGPPFVFPLATALLVGLTVAMIAVFSQHKEIFAAGTIGKVDGHDKSTWYRMLSGLFVHGLHHELQAVVVLSALAWNGFRTERAVGASGVFLCFLVGGIAGNVVRLFTDSPALLEASAGTTAGAIALTGAGACALVRQRVQSIPRARSLGVLSSVLTILFSAGQLQGVYVFSSLPEMLPSAGVAFLAGSFVASIYPLHEAKKHVLPRGGVVLVALALLGFGAFKTNAALKALLARTPQQVEEEDLPGLERKTSPGFGYSFGVPIGHHLEPDPKVKSRLYLVPNGVYGSRYFLQTVPRLSVVPWQAFDAEGAALYFAQHVRSERPDSKPQDEGPVKKVPLGPAYRQVLLFYEQEHELVFNVTAVQAPEEFVFVVLQGESDDQRAASVATAIARSLKLVPNKPDKE